MHAIPDLDAILLIAVSLSAKRRPAELVEVMAATDLTPGALAAEFKLADAFHRLSTSGLICKQGGGVTLTSAGQELMAAQPRKATSAANRIIGIKDGLMDFYAAPEDIAMDMTVEQLRAAILEHRKTSKTPGKNLLLPKSALAPSNDKRKGQWHKSAAMRRRTPRAS